MGEAGYFDGAAITKPLLHLWSLAIEEQFYILFPILVWGGWRLSHSVRYLGWLVGGITLSSLVGCMLVKDPTVNFYFPLTRFWELGLGICSGQKRGAVGGIALWIILILILRL